MPETMCKNSKTRDLVMEDAYPEESIEKTTDLPKNNPCMVCSAMCCQLFYLKLSPEELWDEYRAFLIGEPEFFFKGRMQKVDKEIGIVAPLVVHMGLFDNEKELSEYCENLRLTIPPDLKQNPYSYPANLYTCRHLRGGFCTIYSARPFMCVNYPYRTDKCGYVNRKVPTGKGEPSEKDKLLELSYECFKEVQEISGDSEVQKRDE